MWSICWKTKMGFVGIDWSGMVLNQPCVHSHGHNFINTVLFQVTISSSDCVWLYLNVCQLLLSKSKRKTFIFTSSWGTTANQWQIEWKRLGDGRGLCTVDMRTLAQLQQSLLLQEGCMIRRYGHGLKSPIYDICRSRCVGTSIKMIVLVESIADV